MSDTPKPIEVDDSRSKMFVDVAQSLRRIMGNDDFDDKGIRTIWHRGRLRCEMLSWENQSGTIIKQELTFFGMVVEYTENKPLRTGKLPDSEETTTTGKVMSHLIGFHSTPSAEILDYGARILKYVPERDFYIQHILKHIHEALIESGIDQSKTGVSKLDRFRSKDKTKQPTLKKNPWLKYGIWALALLVGLTLVMVLV